MKPKQNIVLDRVCDGSKIFSLLIFYNYLRWKSKVKKMLSGMLRLLTHYFELDTVAVPIPFDVWRYASIIASLGSIHPPECKAIRLNYDTIIHVVLNNFSLNHKKNKKQLITNEISNRLLVRNYLRIIVKNKKNFQSLSAAIVALRFGSFPSTTLLTIQPRNIPDEKNFFDIIYVDPRKAGEKVSFLS